MTDEIDSEWVTIVPGMKPIVADSLWAEWRLRHPSDLPNNDIRVDLIRTDGGDLRRYRVRGLHPLLKITDLSEKLRTRCSVAQAIVDDHLDEWDGEILPTLVVSDLRRHIESEFDSHGSVNSCGCIELLNVGIGLGDASVQNAIAVCFVEDACWWAPERQSFFDAWPSALRAEAGRQSDARVSGRPKDRTHNESHALSSHKAAMKVFNDALDGIRNGTLTVGGAEASDNTRSISLTAEQANETSAEFVANFLEQARLAYASQATAHPDKRSLRFYAWVDEMAGQLRFSVSSAHPLPFGASIHLVPDAYDVTHQFLTSPYTDGIPWSELEVVDEGPSIVEHQTDGDGSPLNVYVVALLDAKGNQQRETDTAR